MPKKVVKKVTKKKIPKKTVKKKSVKVDWIKRKKGFQIKKDDPIREDRIIMEIVVDAYGREERVIGWYYSLEMVLDEEYVRCRCSKRRSMSPLQVGEEVEILGMAPLDDCSGEMFVMIHYDGEEIAVPLSQLNPIEGDAEAVTIIEDWLYWCLMGYDF
jgi:hypothetical protein